ncbi:hypothetical protein AMECASPLE_025643 [Ameca splendens]|uniref:Uncharacterized protein n=1 Tax=Ameca splendens TaxID=208324 RepID=A0ABV1AB11_9TELE
MSNTYSLYNNTLVGGIDVAASEHFVLKVIVSEAQKSSTITVTKTVMTRRFGLGISKAPPLEGVRNGPISIRIGPQSNPRGWCGLMIHILFYIMYNGLLSYYPLPWVHMATRCTVIRSKKKAGGGQMMVWAMFCWEALSLIINVDLSTIAWYSLIAVASFSRILHLESLKHSEFQVLTSKFPRPQYN